MIDCMCIIYNIFFFFYWDEICIAFNGTHHIFHIIIISFNIHQRRPDQLEFIVKAASIGDDAFSSIILYIPCSDNSCQ